MTEPVARSDLANASRAIERRGIALGSPLHVLAETTSTNDVAKAAAREGAPHGSTWVAERQTAGRGRQGRAWLGTEGECLMFSVLARVACAPSRLPQLALVAGLAVRDAVAGLDPAIDARVKWPNDVLVDRRKIAGILVESVSAGATSAALVVGIGLNVHARTLPPEIAERATSLALATSRPLDRGDILASLLAELDHGISLVAARGLEAVHARLSRADALFGRPVRTDDGIAGVARGIDREGRLVVERADGSTLALVAGEVHLVR